MGFTQGGVSRRTAGHFLTSMRRRRVPGSGGFMSRAFKWSMELCLVRRTNKPQVHTGFLFPVEKTNRARAAWEIDWINKSTPTLGIHT